MSPRIRPASFSTLRCCDTVAWASGMRRTTSPQKHSPLEISSRRIATRAGWPIARAIRASSLSLELATDDLRPGVVPRREVRAFGLMRSPHTHRCTLREDRPSTFYDERPGATDSGFFADLAGPRGPSYTARLVSPDHPPRPAPERR